MPWQVLGNRRVVATRKDKYSLRRNLRRHHPKTMLPVDSFYPIGTSRIDLQASIALIRLFGAHDSAADRAFGWQCLPSNRTQRQDRGFFMELMLPPQRIHKTALHPPGNSSSVHCSIVTSSITCSPAITGCGRCVVTGRQRHQFALRFRHLSDIFGENLN